MINILVILLSLQLSSCYYFNNNYKKNYRLNFSKNDKLLDKYFNDNDIITKIHENYIPRTKNQQKYIDTLNNNEVKMVIASGSTGSGKTLFATTQAIEYFLKNKVDKIVITRPIISVDEEIGFLPGTIEEKMNPWLQPIYDILYKFFDNKQLSRLLDDKKIEICPLGYMRGRSFHKTYIIADEMQNSTPQQMKMIASRVGVQSKLVITGDVQQSDLKENGLIDICERIDNTKSRKIRQMIKIIDMKDIDVMRSSLTKNILKLYNEKEEIKKTPEDKEINKTSDKNVTVTKDKKIVKNNKKVDNKIPYNDYYKDNKKLNNDCAMLPLNDIPKHRLINDNNNI
tara:strand:- start:1805 stop:2827 length:1023 start_codon:yes stop_codon:yes gene_type:complete